MKALEKDRSRRYESAGGLAEDVRRHLAGEPILAAPPGRAYRIRKALRRHRGPALAAGLVVLALLAGVVGTTWGLLRAEARRAEAERAAAGEGRARRAEEASARAASARAGEAAAVLQFLRDRVLAAARPKGRRGGLGRDVTILAALDAAEPAIAAAFPSQPGVEAGVRDAFGWTYWHQSEYGRAAVQFERALALRRSALGPDHPDALASGYALASAWFYLPGRLEDAIALEEDVLRRREAALGPGHPDTEGVRANLALSYYHAGRREAALELAERTYRRLEADLGPDAPATLVAGTALAVPLAELRPTPATADFLCGLLERMDRILGPDSHDAQSTRGRLARLLAGLGRDAEAIPLWEEVLDRWTKSGAGANPWETEAMHELAKSYRAVGRHADALKLYDGLIASNPGPPGRALGNGASLAIAAERVDALLEDRQFERAAEDGRELLAAERAAYSPGDHRIAATLERIGLAELEAGRAGLAEPALREGLAIRAGHEGEARTSSAARGLLGRALLALGRHAEAEPLLVAAYEALGRHEGETPAGAGGGLPAAVDRLIELYTALRRPDEAARWRAERSKHAPR